MNKFIDIAYKVFRIINNSIFAVCFYLFWVFTYVGVLMVLIYLELPNLAEIFAWSGIILAISYFFKNLFDYAEERLKKNE